MTSSSITNSVMSVNISKLDELRKQQIKLDKIKAEKSKLQAFLNYQEEMEKEKKKKQEQLENLRNLEYIYHTKAIIHISQII